MPGAQAIGRAIAALRAVAVAPDGATTTVVSGQIGLPRTTVIRLLKALAVEGLVRLDPATGRYQVGAGVLELAGQYLCRQDVRRVALPDMWQLAETTRETVNLAIQDGAETVCIEQIESPHAIRAVNWLGRRLPVHATATGKAWLAYQPSEATEDLVAHLIDSGGQLPQLAARTIVDPHLLRQDLALTRRRGYAVTHEELEPWLNAVAAPVFSHEAAVVAALVVSGPSFRLTARRMAEFGTATVSAANAISAALGFRSAQHTPTYRSEGR